MKYLKIENNKGLYRLSLQQNNWKDIDQINKDDLLVMLELASSGEFEMEEYSDDLLRNPAHNIIYKNIYNKFCEFLNNKTRFDDSVNVIYKQALEKYKL